MTVFWPAFRYSLLETAMLPIFKHEEHHNFSYPSGIILTLWPILRFGRKNATKGHSVYIVQHNTSDYSKILYCPQLSRSSTVLKLYTFPSPVVNIDPTSIYALRGRAILPDTWVVLVRPQ